MDSRAGELRGGGDAGATEALTVSRGRRAAVSSTAPRIGARGAWKREGGWRLPRVPSSEGRGGRSRRAACALPEGRRRRRVAPGDVHRVEVDDPESAFGLPEEVEIRSEVLEALLALLSGVERCREAFVEGGGVQTAASYLVPWLAEGGGEEAPSELVQRCIVFLGVLVRHVLPKSESRWTPGAREDARDGRSLAEEAEATLEATIGAEATRGDSSRRGGVDPANAAGDVDVAPEEGWSEGEEEEEDDEGEGVADGEASRRVDARAEGERRGVERRDARDDGGGSRGDGAANGRGG